MGTVGNGPKEKPPGDERRAARIPEENWRDIEKLLPYPPSDPVSPDTALREFLELGLAAYAEHQGLTDEVYLDYPARTDRLTAQKARATLRDLGIWAASALRLGVPLPPPF